MSAPDTCNSVTGQLCATVLPVPAGSKPQVIEGEAKGYKTSGALERFFSETCGTSVYEDASGMVPGLIYLDSGAVEVGELQAGDRNVPVSGLKEHIFVADTKDGGLRDWTARVPAWEGWMNKSKYIPVGEYYVSIPKTPEWFMLAEGAKYNAFLCVCNDCRFSSGYEVSAWAIIPKKNFRVAAQTEVSPANARGPQTQSTMSDHESSSGVHRQFCKACGATLSFFNEQSPNIMHVSVGLMKGKTGCRVEDWLVWQTEEIGYEGLAQNVEFVKAVSSGLKAWGVHQDIEAERVF